MCNAKPDTASQLLRESVFHSAPSLHTLSVTLTRGRKGREGERQALAVPHRRLSGSQACILGLDEALMTGLGTWDTGPTGDLQVPVDKPEPDSHPARVGL